MFLSDFKFMIHTSTIDSIEKAVEQSGKCYVVVGVISYFFLFIELDIRSKNIIFLARYVKFS